MDSELSLFINRNIFSGFAMYTLLLGIYLLFGSYKRIAGLDRVAAYIFIGGAVISLYMSLSQMLPVLLAPDDTSVLARQIAGPYAVYYWVLIALPLLSLLLLSPTLRRSFLIRPWFVILFALPFDVIIIIITSLHRDYLSFSSAGPFLLFLPFALLGHGLFYGLASGIIYAALKRFVPARLWNWKHSHSE